MDELRVLVATNRRALPALFADLGRRSERPLVVSEMPLDPAALLKRREIVARAMVAVVDAAADPQAAVRLCRDLGARRVDLPLAAFLCCTTPATPWHVEALLAAGIRGALDAHATPEELLRVLMLLASGGGGLHLRLHPNYGVPVSHLVGGTGRPWAPKEADVQLLKLVARGLTDAEIGERLHLSRNTAHHKVGRLCAETETRNRQELAAWAAHHGLYRPEAAGEPIHPASAGPSESIPFIRPVSRRARPDPA